MNEARSVDAMCPACGEVQVHETTPEDPGSCTCTVCGSVQQLMVPFS